MPKRRTIVTKTVMLAAFSAYRRSHPPADMMTRSPGNSSDKGNAPSVQLGRVLITSLTTWRLANSRPNCKAVRMARSRRPSFRLAIVAPRTFPEHTKQSYEAAARMGAGLSSAT